MILKLKNLAVEIGNPAHPLRILRSVDISIAKGTVHGVIGESGCGKSVIGMSCLGLLPSAARISAEDFSFDGLDLRQAAADLRGRRICLVSQDPAAALNPVLRISTQLDHVLRAHSNANSKERLQTARTLLAETGLPDPDKVLGSYPLELSGGMQQRVVIAQALATGAEFLIADEPTTALDRTTGRQVLHILRQLVATRGLTVMIISHDMDVIADICDEATVVYAGTVIENGPIKSIMERSGHPYTQALLKALPRHAQKGTRLAAIEGLPPTPLAEINGCVFAARCQFTADICHLQRPPTRLIGNHSWACHFEVADV